MAENYKKLLKLLATSNLPSSFVPPPSYNMLLYESYYHFGIALQNLGRHKESILVYTSALHSMNLRKVKLIRASTEGESNMAMCNLNHAPPSKKSGQKTFMI